MRHYVGLCLLATLTAGCVKPVFERAADAPRLAPVEVSEVVDRPPLNAILLGTAEVQSSVYQAPEECQSAALLEAKRAGATHVIIRPAIPGTGSRGPRCRVEAYYVAPKR